MEKTKDKKIVNFFISCKSCTKQMPCTRKVNVGLKEWTVGDYYSKYLS